MNNKIQSTIIYLLSVIIVGLFIAVIVIFLYSQNKKQVASIDYSTKPVSKKVDHSIRKVYVPEDHISAEEATLKQQEMNRGPKPSAYSKGNGSIIDNFFSKSIYDYSAMQVVSSSDALEIGYDAWGMKIQIRGKNRLGAYTMSMYYFLIKNNSIIDIDVIPI